MFRLGPLAAIFAIVCLSFVACDDDAVAPPAGEPPAPLLDGPWTLRLSPRSTVDAFLVPGAFAAAADTVVFSTAQGDFTGDVTGRRVTLAVRWEENERPWEIDMTFDVAANGETLTGTFGGFGKPAGGEDIEGTLFGAPGDEIPRIDVSVSPSYITLPPQASLQLLARVTGCDNRAVTWSLFPAGAGSLDGAGRYTAPGSAPDPPLVTITATSTVDIGASGDAAVNIEVPPPTCDFVHGNWEVHILIETADGFQDDCYDLAYWFFVQDECSLTLYDRGRQVELGMTGAYAQGVLQIPSAQYTYGLHFRDGVEIADGSGIEYLSLFEPTEPHYRPVLGFKLVTD